MAKYTVQKSFITYNDRPILVKHYTEKRQNSRFSIGKKEAILRMPAGIRSPEKKRLIVQFENWVKTQFENIPELRARFFGKEYKDGDQLTILEKTYRIHIKKANRKTHHASIKGVDIFIELSDLDDSPFIQKSIQTLLSRVIGKDNMPEIERRVDYWNDHFYQEEINAIRLKRNQSNWGSCSSNRNLNFSTRLLFAPSDVIDYVIIHELAHLKEMNHSAKFWNIVANVMPDYKSKERWLKENGHLCSF